MRLTIKIFALLILTSGMVCCDTVKRKAEQVTEKSKEKTKRYFERQAENVVDKIFPPFDHDKPDTENNKKRLRDFLKIEITPDVKNIYCFDDAIGIDADYMFSFECNVSTSIKIIDANGFKVDTVNMDNAFALQHDFDWWDKERIADLQKYSWSNGEEYFKYYWYDAEKAKAYFFDFDM